MAEVRRIPAPRTLRTFRSPPHRPSGSGFDALGEDHAFALGQRPDGLEPLFAKRAFGSSLGDVALVLGAPHHEARQPAALRRLDDNAPARLPEHAQRFLQAPDAVV